MIFGLTRVFVVKDYYTFFKIPLSSPWKVLAYIMQMENTGDLGLDHFGQLIRRREVRAIENWGRASLSSLVSIV